MNRTTKLLAALIASMSLQAHANILSYEVIQDFGSVQNFVDFSNLHAEASGDFHLPKNYKYEYNPITQQTEQIEIPYTPWANSNYTANRIKETGSIEQTGAANLRTRQVGNVIETQQRFVNYTKVFDQTSLNINAGLYLYDASGSGSLMFSGTFQLNDKAKNVPNLPTFLNGSASANSSFDAALINKRNQRPVADIDMGSPFTSFNESVGMWNGNAHYSTSGQTQHALSSDPTSFSFAIEAARFNKGNINFSINGGSWTQKIISETNSEEWRTISTAPVPEPETYALMGMGLIGLLAARRRKLAN